VLIEIFVGTMVAFFMKSGSMQTLAAKLSNGKRQMTRRMAQFLSTLLGIFIFFSDYFSPLFTGNVMRGITDKVKVSREKLAYICDCTSAPMCICVPFDAWGVYVAGLVVGIGSIASAEIGTNAVVHATVYQFYGYFTILFCLLISLGVIPDFGPMKKAEKRAFETGEVYAKGSNPMLSGELDTIQPKEGVKCNLFIHFIVPALIIISWTLGTYFIKGSAKTLEAFVLAVLYQAIMLLVFRMANLREIMSLLVTGTKSVLGAILILGAAYCINSISKTLGTANYIISITENWMTPVTLLAMTFLSCSFISFFTGTSWGTYAIMIPICLPLAFNYTGGALSPLIYATIAAVMGGGCFGDHCSPLSDTTILSSTGSGSDHIDHTRTQLPYALTVCGVSLVAYVIVGFCLS